MNPNLEVRLIRHAPKFDSKHTDSRLANQLTPNGRLQAYLYGVARRVDDGCDALHVITWDNDRNKETAGLIQAGYDGKAFARAEKFARNAYQPTLDDRLTQLIPEGPESIRKLFKEGKLSRSVLTEAWYAMLANRSAYAADDHDRQVLQRGAEAYLNIASSYLTDEQPQAFGGKQKPLVVLVGNDPNLGALQQLLEKDAQLRELQPLEGITFNVQDQQMTYTFRSNGTSYSGIVTPTLFEAAPVAVSH